jgi:hypothetical protein
MQGRQTFRFLALFLACILTACTSLPKTGPVSPLPAQSPLLPVASPPAGAAANSAPTSNSAPVTPVPGTGVVSGQLYTLSGHAGIPETTFYLVGKETQSRSVVSPDEKYGDVQGRSDKQGRFVMNGVPPGEYQVMVRAAYQWVSAVQSEFEDTPLSIKVQAGQQLDLGKVNFWWP